MAENKIVYSEPEDYFPKEIREKYKLGEFAESKELRQIKAVMLGHAVGDAIGVPVEFCSREELDEAPVTDMQGWGSYPVPEGCWSDDTSMALATLDSLKKGSVDYEDIMHNFVAWCTEDKYTPTGEMFDIGRTCLAAIRAYMKDNKPALECGLDDEHSNGNGSLMRIHPMALYLFSKGIVGDEGVEIIHNTSSLTHSHPRAKIACGIYSLILWELLKKPYKASVLDGMRLARRIYGGCKMFSTSKDYLLYDKFLMKRIGGIYRHWEDDDPREVTREEIKSTGYVVDTLGAAAWCLLTTNSYKECVLKAVNLGEDTDTVAAVTGGLAGALYGIEAIPEEWLNALKKREYIEEMCEEAYKSWKNVI